MNLTAMLALLIVASSSGPVVPGDRGRPADAARPGGDSVVDATSSTPDPLMALMEAELAYAMKNLVAVDGTRPYFMSYTVYDEQTAVVSASLGALNRSLQNDDRKLNIDLRVGDYSLDNTHQIRGSGVPFAHGNGNIALALDGDPESIRHALWLGTDRAFKQAVQRFARIRTNLKVNVEEQDQSDDFSREAPQVHFDSPVQRIVNRSEWEARIRNVSAIARSFPLIYGSSVTLGTFAGTRYQVDSEGGRLRTAGRRCRITLTATSKAEDGMDLRQTVTLNARTVDRLPGTDKIEAAFRGVIEQVLALRDAPLAEPYTGPAIMHNRASAVFFHEIFGHRIEGHRQRDVTEGQTFTQKIEKRILPDFITIFDDPTTPRLGDIDLRGHYLFDDEGVPSSRVSLVEKGILKSFLMCRRPVEGFPRSNGHGRRQPGRAVVARQGNLIVESSRRVPFERLREMLIDECKRQGKPYGLRFEDISGGFTTTSRRGPQMFKVLPIVVYRVYADGRPDELIRGADVVGTPLSSLEKILCTADDPAVFNGSCGAESGWVPVSAISPSILVSTIEIEKRTHAQGRPPILAPPLGLPDQAAVPSEDQDTIMRAMADELQRAIDGLTLNDLPRPFFIQFRADDRFVFTAQAYYGGLTKSSERRTRSFRSRVRVGSYDSDNTNVGGGGRGASLPLDDDDSALRHAMWAAVDRDYKRAVEILTRKQAYLRDKNIEDRPPDFSAAPPVRRLDPPARLSIDRKDWEDRLTKLSARFREFPPILESAVSIFAGTSNEYVVNTEGTRLRVGDTGALLTIDAALQAEEGMWLRDGRTFLAEKPQELPTLDELLTAIDELCKDLISLSRAPMCDHYAGPVLFEPVAAGKMFAALLGDGLCARPVPLGRKAAPDGSLENKLGLRILPRSFQIYDDPRDRTFNGTLLAGAYEYDDEAVHSERVSLVESGTLKNLLSSRSPTEKVSRSNGHGRSGGLGDARARVGCLYVFAENGVSPEQLKHRLIEAARQEGLAFGLRIKSLQDGGQGALGKPIYAYKVYVDDGREELVRGLEFLPVETRALKHILAGGTQREVYNATASVVTSFISPAVILEDLELSKLQKEFNKLPILKAPDARN